MHDEWLNRWQEGRIGWHEAAGNRALKTHWTATGRNVLVPLCGKSPDLMWLCQQGNTVTGVELSSIAATEFFAEHGLEHREKDGVFEALDKPLRIVVGDYFGFSETGFNALYDRAALVALPGSVRPAYAAHTQKLVDDGAFHLLVTLEYDQSRAAGPPYSVGGDELAAYWPELRRIESRSDIENSPPKFRSLDALDEVVWLGGS
ncbi:MAG: thiopurine S-methyltransferase [Woeseiaceae bacterium]|nr:thiopurine S-methyltransferase [Woeseiaceae bacterium]